MNAPSAHHGVTRVPRRLWISMIVRAVPAAIIALVITFTQDHSASFGYLAFGGFALVTGVLVAFEAVGIRTHPARALAFTRGIVSALAGGSALVVGAIPHLASSLGFIIHVAGWAIVTGLLELASAWKVRRKPLFAREVMISGALTLLLGILVAIVPPELRQEYGGVEQIDGVLTASVQSIGYVGAYAAMLAVLLVIEGFTLRAITRQSTAAPDVSVDSAAASGAAANEDGAVQ